MTSSPRLDRTEVAGEVVADLTEERAGDGVGDTDGDAEWRDVRAREGAAERAAGLAMTTESASERPSGDPSSLWINIAAENGNQGVIEYWCCK